MSNTHYEGQRLADCPDCGRTIRRLPERIDDDDTVWCGNCERNFTADA